MAEQKLPIYPSYEQSMLLKALVATYKDHPVAIAQLCDDHLCPSGSLLGVVRDFANMSNAK